MAVNRPGHIELERSLDSIIVGVRHRTDLGDLDPLMESIEQEGVLQPITLTPDGVLVCGLRRLEALRRLGKRTTNVWVRSGLTDRLSQLLAEQSENALHKPLSVSEAEALYRELTEVMAEDAARRQKATRFGATETPQPGGQVPQDSAEVHGGGDSPPPAEQVGSAGVQTGKTGEQAARMVTGRDSHQMLERFGRLKDLAADAEQPAHIRAQAAAEIAGIEAGGSVNGAHLRMKVALALEALDRLAADPGTSPRLRTHAEESAASIRGAQSTMRPLDLARLADEAVDRVRLHTRTGKRKPQLVAVQKQAEPVVPSVSSRLLPPRAFIALFTDLAGWTLRYDPAEIGSALTTEEWANVEQVNADTLVFMEAARAARASGGTAGMLEARAQAAG